MIGIVGLTAGYLSETPVSEIPVVHAACGSAYSCPGGDGTATSVLNVSHGKTSGEYVIPVEPDDGETWYINATWSTSTTGVPIGCSCRDILNAGVYADVTWSDTSGWSVQCTGCNYLNGPIHQVSICHTDGCGNGQSIDNGWGCKLLVWI